MLQCTTRFSLAIACLLVTLAGGCDEYPLERQLPNGYTLIASEQDLTDASVSDPKGEGVVPAGTVSTYDYESFHVGIRRIAVLGAHVVGEVWNWERNDSGGFFVLDTKSGAVTQGLTEADWRERLKALGLASDVSLRFVKQ